MITLRNMLDGKARLQLEAYGTTDGAVKGWDSRGRTDEQGNPEPERRSGDDRRKRNTSISFPNRRHAPLAELSRRAQDRIKWTAFANEIFKEATKTPVDNKDKDPDSQHWV